MGINRFLLLICCTLLIVVSQPTTLNSKVLGKSAVVAQTTDARRQEADKLLDKGVQLAQNAQYDAAFEAWRQALIIYQEIKFPQGEAFVLGNMGLTYFDLGQYDNALDAHKQHLAKGHEERRVFMFGSALALHPTYKLN
jgi:tetratricopeptide (TPR) repeat protein